MSNGLNKFLAEVAGRPAPTVLGHKRHTDTSSRVTHIEADAPGNSQPLLLAVELPTGKPRAQPRPAGAQPLRPVRRARSPETIRTARTTPADAERISRLLLERRTQLALSVWEAARRAQITPLELRHLERGKGHFPVPLLTRLAAVLGLDLATVLGQTTGNPQRLGQEEGTIDAE